MAASFTLAYGTAMRERLSEKLFIAKMKIDCFFETEEGRGGVHDVSIGGGRGTGLVETMNERFRRSRRCRGRRGNDKTTLLLLLIPLLPLFLLNHCV
jgi:hypothetical protein